MNGNATASGRGPPVLSRALRRFLPILFVALLVQAAAVGADPLTAEVEVIGHDAAGAEGPALASDPVNQARLVAADTSAAGSGRTFLATSSDGGQSWNQTTPPFYTPTTTISNGQGSLAWGSGSTLFLAERARSILEHTCESQIAGVYVSRSDDAGASWATPRLVQFNGINTVAALSAPQVAFDPASGRV